MSESDLSSILGYINSWDDVKKEVARQATTSGAYMRKFGILENQSSHRSVLVPATLTALPTPISERLYNDLEVANIEFQRMFDCTSLKLEWLISTLTSMKQVDEFVQICLDIVNAAYTNQKKSYQKCLRAYVTRNDFMLQNSSSVPQWKQIEFNPISAAGAELEKAAVKFHTNVIKMWGRTRECLGDKVDVAALTSRLPCIDGVVVIAEAMKEMIAEYEKIFSISQNKKVILQITADEEANWSDVNSICDAIKDPTLIIVRTTSQVDLALANGTLRLLDCEPGSDPEMGDILVLDGSVVGLPGIVLEVAVIYYRHQYRAEHFQSPASVAARILAEKSRAMSIPSIPAILAGFKKIQEISCDPSVLRMIGDGTETFENLTRFFAHQYDCDTILDDPSGQELLSRAIEHPENFVLKPNREGGSGNYHGQAIVSYLQALVKNPSATRESCILMEKIFPPINQNLMVRGFPGETNSVTLEPTVTEWGLFSVNMWNGAEVKFSKPAGCLLRTKNANDLEGGLVIGVSAADSPILLPDPK